MREPNLKGHLKGPEFFDAFQYPDVTFESTSIHRSGNELTIDGQITIKLATISPRLVRPDHHEPCDQITTTMPETMVSQDAM